MIAIINAHYEFAALLLDAGADPNIVDTEAGMGPLYAVVDMHRLAVGHGRPNPKPVGLMSGVDLAKKLLDQRRGSEPPSEEGHSATPSHGRRFCAGRRRHALPSRGKVRRH